MIFDEETLLFLFDETGMDFDEWVANTGYDEGWTDQQIYNALPSEILGVLPEIGINVSWLHGGM